MPGPVPAPAIAWRPPTGHLAELVAGAAEDCAARRRLRPSLRNDVLRTKPRTKGFVQALTRDVPGHFPLICEVKRASPSQGMLQKDADAPAQAQLYVEGGARCVSVLTERRRFQGELEDLAAVRSRVEVPLLRKDFLVDSYMVFEAAAFGADAVLLIAGALPPSRIAELSLCARELGLDVLLEFVHPHELGVLESVSANLVGVNARDLETLEVDAERFVRLAPRLTVPGRTLVAESGIRTADDIRRFRAAGAGAALVGESLMRSQEPRALVRSLTEAVR
jgi:indole-3-glycerol phosphate synthase